MLHHVSRSHHSHRPPQQQQQQLCSQPALRDWHDAHTAACASCAARARALYETSSVHRCPPCSAGATTKSVAWHHQHGPKSLHVSHRVVGCFHLLYGPRAEGGFGRVVGPMSLFPTNNATFVQQHHQQHGVDVGASSEAEAAAAAREHHLSHSTDSFMAQTDMSGSDVLNFFSFFGGILVPEEDQRAEALQSIADQLLAAAREVVDQANNPPPSPSAEPPSFAAQLLQAHLASVLRLALACPLRDITTAMQQLLRDLTEIDPAAYSKYVLALDFAFQPSLFVPLSSCVDPTGRSSSEAPVGNLSDQANACGSTQELLEDIFLSTGRLSHLDLLMAWHPSFLTQYTSCIHYVMDDAGPLPHTWRNYLAVMAAARHHCEYLVSLQETEYLLKGGDPVWLKGIAYAPKKLQALCELNALLAHQPWLITKAHIAALVHNAGPDFWSIAELVHALVILSTFHALCGFVFALGVRKEIDAMDWANWEPKEGAAGGGSGGGQGAKQAGPQPLQRRATALSGDYSTMHGTSLNSPAAGASSSSSATHSSISITASPGFMASTPTSGGGGGGGGPSDGEHLLRLLSSDTLAPAHPDGLNANNSAFNSAAAGEELSTSPAQHQEYARNALALPPRSTVNTGASATHALMAQGLNDLSLGEGMSSGGGSGSGGGATMVNATTAPGQRGSVPLDDSYTKYLAVSGYPESQTSLHSPAGAAVPAAQQQVSSSPARIAAMRYSTFDVNSKAYSIFFLHDYSWKEHGYALVNRFLGTSETSVAAHSTTTLTVRGSDTTLDLMRTLAQKTGIPLDEQRLTYEGRDLLPHQSLADSHVHADSTLTLLLRSDHEQSMPPPPPSRPAVPGEPSFQVFVAVSTWERRNQGFAQMLDEEWDGIFSLTYNTVSDQTNVDTTPFRRAIWYYTHRLFGLQHDDYNYNRIPVFLTHSLKRYVTKIVSAPETITQADYDLRGYSFKASEKCHIVLLAIEARRQASTLYALHSVMKYMLDAQ